MKKLLAIEPDAILPPRSGGGLRSAHMLLGLGRYFEVQALLPQDRWSIERSLRENAWLAGPQWTAVLGHEAYRIQPILDRICMRYWNWCEKRVRKKWDQLPWGWFFGAHHSWKRILKWMSSSVAPDVFLVEHARNCEIFGFAKKLWPNVLCVCDSHNVESNLLQQILPQGSGKAAMVHAIERYEVHALNRSDLLWTCSQADLDKYRSLGVRAKAVGVLPNGVDTAKIPFTEAQDACGNILFVGNLAYQPNIQGVLWFINNVWPRVKTHLPNAIFQIVGAWPSGEILKFAGDDIKVASDVPSVRPFFESAALAICPLFSGSGTRLKIVEAFSAGIPMVSTSVGAEGLEFEEGVHLFIRNNAEDFAAAIIRLIANPPEREAMRRAARALAEQKYDWKVISASASEQIMSLLP